MKKAPAASFVMFMLQLLFPPMCWPGLPTGSQTVKTDPGFVDLAALRISYRRHTQLVWESVPYKVVHADGTEETKYAMKRRAINRVSISCTVKNLGNRTFRAEKGQAVARLITLTSSGIPRDKITAESPIVDLAAGKLLEFSTSVPWNPPSPGYQLRIVYREDILSDSRTDNNDRNQANDVLECSGRLVDDIIAGRGGWCEAQHGGPPFGRGGR